MVPIGWSPHITVPNAWNGAGYELGALGVPLDRAERRFVHDASKPSCAVCLAAQRVSAERLLMAGAWKTVVLAPQHGEVPMGVWMPCMQVFLLSYVLSFCWLIKLACLLTSSYFLTCLHSVPSVHLVVWCWIWWQVFPWKKQRIIGVTGRAKILNYYRSRLS